MGERSNPVSKIEKMVKKIVAACLEDDEAKGESKRKEQMDDTWQDEEFFTKKMPTKKTEPEPVVSKKFEKLKKKLEKLHVFRQSKGMDQYIDINDDDDEELELKH
ncbi:hypothetical protein JCGZ_19806 [Jatropha curcas]|uniref:Uncharacterized protein n=1 Tax=Jatropha curcas TaxID=180498 RepID=A0A067K5A3_JATCU|nr:hypothetical protein JCGZ_19806 [Jatropha curcas]